MIRPTSGASDPRNQRVLLDEYSRKRGQISADGQVIASTSRRPTTACATCASYNDGPTYAPVTGYYSVTYGTTGIERAENDLLNGS